MTRSIFNYPSENSPVVCWKNHQQNESPQSEQSQPFHNCQVITLKQLLTLVDWLSEQLPEHQHLLNLYDDRFYFLVGFLLGIKRGSISLFPSTVSDHIILQLQKSYADILLLSENNSSYFHQYSSFDLAPLIEQFFVNQDLQDRSYSSFSDISVEQPLAIIFTSGSTGQPKPYEKRWGDLQITSHYLAQHLFEEAPDTQTDALAALIATVPPQHMYGLESSIILPLQNRMLMHSQRPFFPQDISHCLGDLQTIAHDNKQILNATLITTPLHLKACIKTQINLPNIQRFISATDLLEKSLAEACEQAYSAPVMEVYGCTEVGSIAWRKTTDSEHWTLLEDIQLEQLDNEVKITTDRSIKHFLLNDYIGLLNKHQFLLQGRKEDLVNIAGKRTSLAWLNHHLQACESLTDACYFLYDKQQGNETIHRLVAFVIDKSHRDEKEKIKQIRNHLKSRIESTFLPKRIYFVSDLPRNPTGKLPRSELKKCLLQIESNND